MAVSSSIGSNVFDILVGLPVPWMIYNAYFGETITIASPYLVVSTFVHVCACAFLADAVVDTRILHYDFFYSCVSLEQPNQPSTWRLPTAGQRDDPAFHGLCGRGEHPHAGLGSQQDAWHHHGTYSVQPQ